MTLAETLHDAAVRLRAAGIDDAWLEAEVLLCHALGVQREALFTRLTEPMERGARDAFEGLLQRRLAYEPTAYIVGHREFYGLELACTPAALIPRQETELLVEYVLAWLQGRRPRPSTLDPRPWIVDVGTGNGAIAVALSAHAPEARIVGIDTARPALMLARRNAEAHKVAERVDFIQGALLAPVRGTFDLIVANLPYVPSLAYAKLAPEIRGHEPEVALHAGRRGTALIERLLELAPHHLGTGGLLLVEHAWNQGKRLREAARAAFPNAVAETKRDLAGLERMLVVENA